MKNEATDSPPNNGGIIIKNLCYKGRIKRTEGDEYVEILNSGTSPVSIAGYKLTAGSQRQQFVFPAKTVLPGGKSVRVYTNHHEPKTGGLSFNSKTAIWNNKGDEAVLSDASGAVVSRYGYGSHKAKKPSDGASGGTSDESAGKASNAVGALSAGEVWTRVKAMWPGFDFMWRPGDSDADIAATEARLGIKLRGDVKLLMKECSGASGGFPVPSTYGFSAEVTLLPVKYWQSVTSSGKFDMTAEEAADLAGDDLKNTRPADLLLIGEDPHGADYGIFVILDNSTGKMYGLTLNEGGSDPLGSFDEWLLGTRPFKGFSTQSQAYVGTYGYDKDEAEDMMSEEDFEGAKTIAQKHRDYLGYTTDEKYLREAWDAVAQQFIETVDRLNKK